MKLKDYYDLNYVRNFASAFSEFAMFNTESYIKKVEAKLTPDLSYKQRLKLIAEVLHHEVNNYALVIHTFTLMLGEELSSFALMYEEGKKYAPLGQYVEDNAYLYAEHYILTMNFIYELTKRYTGEFAIRPLLNKWPDVTLGILKTWAKDKSAYVRRLSSEGLRIKLPWAKKSDIFLTYYEECKQILLLLLNDDNKYVLRSIANNLNELSKVDETKANELITAFKNKGSPHLDKIIHHGTRTLRKKART